MHEGASAGETSIPAPVQVDVDDDDMISVRRAVERKRFGIVSPYLLAVGICQLASFGLSLTDGRNQWWLLIVAIAFTAFAFHPASRVSKAQRAIAVRFADDGVRIDVPFSPPVERTYRWRDIVRIDDIADAFVVIPRFDQQIVMPKRDFPDEGCEAWAFFTAHGVAGHVTPSRSARGAQRPAISR